ncbi:MAG: hypothetical protein MUF24_04390 [Chitinophagaceae bacterium]|jgi:hypothetical protein|nr:hypothetical protein [Chitinophagaceae bacterium]
MKQYILVGLLLLVLQAKAQVTSLPVSAGYLNLGAYSQKFNDVYGTRANVASLAGLQRGGVGAYAERRFMQDNMNFYSLSAAFKAGSGAFGLYGTYFGFSQSNNNQLSLAYARKVAQKVEVGAAFHYHLLNQASVYGNASAITGSVALRMYLSEKITAGVQVYNPVRAAWSKLPDEKLPARYSFGLGYDASDKFFISAEIEQEENQDLNVLASFQYIIVPQVFVRAGISTLASNYFAGVGLRLKDFRFDVSMAYHPRLGISPGALVMIDLGKNNTTAPKAP